jgi:protein-S-isoprenylcysteine O-methyltransferase Ste14
MRTTSGLKDDRMAELELKVPPDVVALVVAVLMWLVSAVTPSLQLPPAARLLAAVALAAAGIGLIVAARIAFAKAGTTFSPVAPQRSSRLVATGVYRRSRNPMYLGTLLVLFAVAAWLADPASLAVALSYVAYMDRFQIAPEERTLHQRFGAAYEDYTHRVRRWA